MSQEMVRSDVGVVDKGSDSENAGGLLPGGAWTLKI